MLNSFIKEGNLLIVSGIIGSDLVHVKIDLEKGVVESGKNKKYPLGYGKFLNQYKDKVYTVVDNEYIRNSFISIDDKEPEVNLEDYKDDVFYDSYKRMVESIVEDDFYGPFVLELSL